MMVNQKNDIEESLKDNITWDNYSADKRVAYGFELVQLEPHTKNILHLLLIMVNLHVNLLQDKDIHLGLNN